MPAPLAPFSLPARYRLEGGIAAGGMAAVYAAHDEVLDRPVAVKVLAEHLSSDDTARRRFEREARAAASLSSHPAVVTIFDVGEHEGRSFIVMERRTGGTVGEQIAEHGRIDPGRAIAWLHAAADALDAAHERGIVHRDIKPGNLLLDEHDRLAVADFGIARLAFEDQVTQTGQVLGTASYISPEQAVGDPATPASDRYALAVVAFQLLTGERPYTGDHFAAQARAHIEDPVPSARERASELPAAVDTVLARGLAKEPEERWPSARAFTDALEEALREGAEDETAATAPLPPHRRGVAAGAVSAAGAAGAAAAAGPGTAQAGGGHGGPGAPRRSGTQPPRRRGVPAPVLAAAALLIVAALALAIAVSGGGEDGAGERAAEPTPEATPQQTATPEAEQTPEPEPTAAPTEAPEEPSGGNPATLNDQGFARFQAGDYEGALPYFTRAVEACGDSAETVCAYATYNLGASLHRSGRHEEAIPVLERRLERWPDNQPGTVRKELKAACKAAGAECGKGSGKDKGEDDDD